MADNESFNVCFYFGGTEKNVTGILYKSQKHKKLSLNTHFEAKESIGSRKKVNSDFACYLVQDKLYLFILLLVVR